MDPGEKLQTKHHVCRKDLCNLGEMFATEGSAEGQKRGKCSIGLLQ